MSVVQALPGLDPGAYRHHALHGEGTDWAEKNCYADLWVEFLHSLGLEPRAMLPFTVAVDFEGDQWTFFKPPHGELHELYGLDVQELNVWRPLAEHALEHLAAGRLVSTEADAWWLPDTAGTDYRRQHTKTTIVLTEVDLDRQFAAYFHNGGFFQVEGEDFRELFRVDLPADAPYALPLFAETIRADRIVRRPLAEQVLLSLQYLGRHVARRPATNPVKRFAERWAAELPLLQRRGLAHYHAWAFATLRQLGAAFELAARNLEWLGAHGEPHLAPAVQAFDAIANGSKTLILKGARAVTSGKPLDVSALLGEMAAAWERGMDVVASRCPA